jgi:hypothetical protein
VFDGVCVCVVHCPVRVYALSEYWIGDPRQCLEKYVVFLFVSNIIESLVTSHELFLLIIKVVTE